MRATIANNQKRNSSSTGTRSSHRNNLRSFLTPRKALFLLVAILIGFPNVSSAKQKRDFISHRGVSLNFRLAGENSLDAIRLAALAGYQIVETDVRETKDGHLVIMHDALLNRTCKKKQGRMSHERIFVKDLTLREIEDNYCLQTYSNKTNNKIPTFEEYLTACKKYGLKVFVEPKVMDSTGAFYRKVIEVADRIMGRKNYAISSQNIINEKIRRMGFQNVQLMSILREGEYDLWKKAGNTILFVVPTKYTWDDYHNICIQAGRDNIPCLGFADKFSTFDQILQNPVQYIFTDNIAPDYHNQGTVVWQQSEKDLFNSDSIRTWEAQAPNVHFGGLYLQIEAVGKINVQFGNQHFTLNNKFLRKCSYQIIVGTTAPQVYFSAASDDALIKHLEIKLVDYEKTK